MYWQRTALPHRSLIVAAYVGIDLIKAKIWLCSYLLSRKKEEMSIKTVLELVFCPTCLSQLRRVGFTHLFFSQTWSNDWIKVVLVREAHPATKPDRAQLPCHRATASPPPLFWAKLTSCWLLSSIHNLQQQGFRCSPGTGMEPAGCSNPDPPRTVLFPQYPQPQRRQVVLDRVPQAPPVLQCPSPSAGITTACWHLFVQVGFGL